MRLVGAPLRAADDVGRLAGRGDRGRQRQRSTGACGGLISTALMFCAKRLLDVGGHVAERRASGRRRRRSGHRGIGRAGDRDLHRGGAADEHRFGAVRCAGGCRGPRPRVASASYHGPHVPSGRLARTRADVPVRSSAVSATIENGVSWWISRIVSPPPTPVSGCWASRGVGAPGRSVVVGPGMPLIAHGSMTTVAAMAVKQHRRRRSAGRHGLMLRMGQLLPVFRHGQGCTNLRRSLQRHRRAEMASAVPFGDRF